MYDGDINMTFSNMTLKTEDTQKFLYVKSSIPSDANSNITYTSAINLSYLEV